MANLLENKRARFDYEIIETWEAGIELVGSEIKSLKSGKGNLTGTYVKIFNNEAYIMGMQIDEYQKSTLLSKIDKTRSRKLLLNKSELKKMTKYTEEKGLTLVPLSMYIKNRWIKLSIAAGRGKKNKDKRETIKKRDVERNIRREYSVR